MPPTGDGLVIACSYGVVTERTIEYEVRIVVRGLVIPPAGMCIACGPWVTTGELLKWKVIVCISVA